MQKTTHIYWFAPYNLSCPSTRYRGLLPLEHLAKNEALSFDFFYPERNIKAYFRFLFLWLKILFGRKPNSKIVIQKICSNRGYAKALKILLLLRNKDTIYDIDDAEYIRQPTQSLHFFLKHCAMVHVGSPALLDYCSQYNPNVRILTSPVPKHQHKKQNRNDVFTIGWVGDFGNGNVISKDFAHKTSLFNILFPALIAIKTPIKLILIGIKNKKDLPKIKAYFRAYPNIQLEIPFPLSWEKDDWVYSKILDFDIGVSPMVSHPFNEAKSAFKAKQYLSCGVPTIASAIGENNHFIHHKKNGLLCQSSDDFTQAIRYFMDMEPKQYAQYVQNALDSFETFSLSNYSEMMVVETNE